jgi:ABC-type protease/lipase transport system fused ATPase/permease subunit
VNMQDLVILPSINFTEVFNTNKGAIYQSDSENCWYIDFAGKLARFDYRNLLKLKKAVYQIDIENLLLNSTKAPDLEIIFICACDHCYVLSILEIIALKELLQGTFVMLELNHIIFDRLHRIVA